MAYRCGYATGYQDPCFCVPTGYGGGPYAELGYAGYEICAEDVSEADFGDGPNSNVRNLCIVRCN